MLGIEIEQHNVILLVNNAFAYHSKEQWEDALQNNFVQTENIIKSQYCNLVCVYIGILFIFLKTKFP